jgi:hypothetical protein
MIFAQLAQLDRAAASKPWRVGYVGTMAIPTESTSCLSSSLRLRTKFFGAKKGKAEARAGQSLVSQGNAMSPAAPPVMARSCEGRHNAVQNMVFRLVRLQHLAAVSGGSV